MRKNNFDREIKDNDYSLWENFKKGELDAFSRLYNQYVESGAFLSGDS